MADEADTPHVEAPRRAPPVVVPRWVQLVMLPLGVLALYALAQAAGVVLLLFTVAAVVALILNPLVQLLQRARLPRTLAVIAVYAVFFTALPVTGFLLSSPVSDQATSFANDVPGLVDGASRSLDDLQRFLHRKGIHVQIKGQSESALASLQKQVVAGSGQIVAVTGELLRTLVELSFYLILVIVLSIYMLIYAPEIGRPATARRRTTSRRACSTRCSATCAGSSCSASRWERAPASRCGSSASCRSSRTGAPTPSRSACSSA
jgi:predicted PurR-regulated permease PerM